MSTLKETSSTTGFAAMDPERQREISRDGGRAAHALGVAFEYEAGSEKAREAGRKGGRTHSREHMREIGRLGGLARKAARAQAPQASQTSETSPKEAS